VIRLAYWMTESATRRCGGYAAGMDNSDQGSHSALSAPARALAQAIEPFVGSVYFSPECHARYVALGFAPSVREMNGVALPDGPAYFTSRGSLMGQVPGEVVAAAFGVFNPAAVVPSVTYGWTLTDARTICEERRGGAVDQLRRILGAHIDGIESVVEPLQRAVDACPPAGRPLFAGAVSQTVPTEPLAAAWHLGDCLREYRGDSHTAAWIAAGLDAVEIGLLTELWWGIPLHTYVRTRAWSDEQVGAAMERLRSRGLLNGLAFTDAGRELRASIETATDNQMAAPLAAFGNDHELVVSRFMTWSAAVRHGRGYPMTGPEDLAKLAGRS
jgi:hypothetical protein